MLRVSHRLLKLPFAVQRRCSQLPYFDLCVIGGGPAGIAAATRAASLGKKVCLVEGKRVGGTEVWNGAVSSKALWEVSQFTHKLNSADFMGRFLDPTKAAALTGEIDQQRLAAGLRRMCEEQEADKLGKLRDTGVHLIKGVATFSDAHSVDVHTVGTGEYQQLSADYFLIATGSTPREHPHYPSDGKYVVTSEHFYNLPIPKSIVIIGAGVIGCECAATLANLGQTKVYVLDKAPRILSSEDEDVALKVQRELELRGVTFHHNCHLFDLEVEKPAVTSSSNSSDTTATAAPGRVHYAIQNKLSGVVETFSVDRAFVSIGRTRNYDSLGLYNTDLRVSNGALVTDAYNRCLPYRHIYCVGDAGGTTKAAVVSMAQHSARAAVHDMYGDTGRCQPQTDNYSHVMFFDEEVACIGLSEQECRARQMGYLVAKYEYHHLTRAAMSAETKGFVKLIVSRGEKRILGVRATGPHSGSVVEVVASAIREGQSAYQLLSMQPSFPVIVHGLVECARLVIGRGSVQPNKVPGITMKEWVPSGIERGRAYSDPAPESEAAQLVKSK